MARDHAARIGSPVESNARFKQLVEHGATCLSVAFDLPTRMGRDSDTPLAHGQVGRSGVAVDSVDDMRVLFSGIPLDRVSLSLTADAPAAPLLLMYQLVGEEQGITSTRLTGTFRHAAPADGTFPPESVLRLTTDLVAYCATEIPAWDTAPLSGHRPSRRPWDRKPKPDYPEPYPAPRPEAAPDPVIAARQTERLAKLRAWRVRELVDAALTDLRKAAEGTDNVLYPMKEALRAGATGGEVCDALREVWGTQQRSSPL